MLLIIIVSCNLVWIYNLVLIYTSHSQFCRHIYPLDWFLTKNWHYFVNSIFQQRFKYPFYCLLGFRSETKASIHRVRFKVKGQGRACGRSLSAKCFWCFKQSLPLPLMHRRCGCADFTYKLKHLGHDEDTVLLFFIYLIQCPGPVAMEIP